jgi:hypothetical protein
MNTSDRKKIIVEAKQTSSTVKNNFSKRSEHIRKKLNYLEVQRRELIYNCESSEAKQTYSFLKKVKAKRTEFVQKVKLARSRTG